ESEMALHNEVMMKALRERDPSASFGRPTQTSDDAELKKWYDSARRMAGADASGPQVKAKADPKGKKGGGTPLVGRALEYPYQPSPNQSGDTFLWYPNLFLPNGAGEVRFNMATVEATYRVLLLGHSPTGRFGFHESRLDIPTALGR